MSSFFGGSSSTTEQGFNTMPWQARRAYLDLINRAYDLSQDSSLFAPEQLSDRAQQAIDLYGLPGSAQEYRDQVSVFFDPFQDEVIGGVEQDLQRNLQGIFSNIGSGASAAGGFGGTRQALLESEGIRETQDRFGNIAGRLRSAGFADAQNRYRQALEDQMAGEETRRQIAQGIRQAPLQGPNYLGSTIAGSGFPSIGQNIRTTQRSSGGLGGLVGGIGNLAFGLGSLGGALPSFSGFGGMFAPQVYPSFGSVGPFFQG